MKEEIRREIKEKRNSLSKSEILEKSNRIKKRLFEQAEFRKAQTILFYVSYGSEVYTHDMIKESLSEGKNVVVPYSDTEKRTLILSELHSWNELSVGSYNILEPKKENIKEVAIAMVDMILVPGVAFDVTGRRIGHGWGYYDKLLEKSNAPSIGLAFELQIVDAVPTEEHDVAVGKIITEKRTIIC